MSSLVAEINLTFAGTAGKSLPVTIPQILKELNVGDYVAHGQQIVTTGTIEALDIPTDLGDKGYILIENLNTVGSTYIELGPTNVAEDNRLIRLANEDVAFFKINGAAIYAHGVNAGSAQLAWWVFTR